jgi:hypothetical protein
MEENRVEMLARRHGIRQKRDDGGLMKTLAAFIPAGKNLGCLLRWTMSESRPTHKFNHGTRLARCRPCDYASKETIMAR